MAEFFWFVLKRKTMRKGQKMGSLRERRDHVSPPFSHCKNFSSQLCTCPSPWGSQGGAPQRSSQGPVWDWRGHAKEGLCPPPSLLPPPVFTLGAKVHRIIKSWHLKLSYPLSPSGGGGCGG